MVSRLTLDRYPPDSYHCVLDEQPYYLVPPRLIRPEAGGPLIVNPLCWFSWHGGVPTSMSAQIQDAETFLPAECIVWVPDPGIGAVWPYWVGHEYIRWLAPMLPGQLVPTDLPPQVTWVLRHADIIVTQDHIQRRRGEWVAGLVARAASLKHGYAVLPNMIPPFQVGAMRRYYRHKVRTNSFQFGDGQVRRRYVAHNDPVARYVQRQLIRAMIESAAVKLKPSYTYLAAYQSGAELERHTDRKQCEYSITLLVDGTPEPSQQHIWPIKLDTRRGTLAVWQYLGEALFYRGRKLPHYRDPLPTGCTSTSLLLHYVDWTFQGGLA
jgi:hypothetical protein